MNVFEHSLEPFYTINVKNCKEVSFCNGGHLFAIVNNNMVDVY